MLDRHAVQELLRAGVRPRQVAQQLGISRRTVERIAREPAVTAADDYAARAARRLGRPQVDATIRAAVRRLVEEDPAIPPGEVCRRLREAGTPLGLSTTYRVLAQARQEIPAEIMVRFEGVAGELGRLPCRAGLPACPVRLRAGRRTAHRRRSTPDPLRGLSAQVVALGARGRRAE